MQPPTAHSLSVSAGAAAFWDGRFRDEAPRIRDWLELPYIRERYIEPAMTLNGGGWFAYVCEQWLQPPGRLLELGCGSHGVAFEAYQRGAAQRALGIDVSAEAIRISSERVAAHGIADRLEYICGDSAALDFAEGSFDAVFVNMALHHILELERLLTNVRRWKKPGGPFVVNEYVGPDRFQWTDAAVREGQRLLDTIDERYRRHGVSGEVVRAFSPPSYAAMVQGDPSEAIRSSAIVPLLETYFDVVERRPYGGTLLQWLLADIVHNFEPELRQEDAAELDRLFDEERRLLREGVLENNFSLMLVR
jgi:O-antigen biosynthesis protein